LIYQQALLLHAMIEIESMQMASCPRARMHSGIMTRRRSFQRAHTRRENRKEAWALSVQETMCVEACTYAGYGERLGYLYEARIALAFSRGGDTERTRTDRAQEKKNKQ
jgi:hypothetical protein